MTDVETITDAAVALDRCGDLFRSDPVGSNLAATALHPAAPSTVLRIVGDDDTAGAVVLIGAQCVVSHLPSDRVVDVAQLLADHVVATSERDEVDQPVLDLSGPAGAVAGLAGALSEHGQGPVVDVQMFRMYEATSIVPPSKRRRGKAFASERDRLDQATEWGVAFGRDTGSERLEDDARSQMERAINEHRLVEWRSGGEVVSQLLISPARFGVVRIGQVYTPGEHRRSGHGAAFVAAVADEQLARQKVDRVILNAQASNASTNRMYRRLGFVSAFEMLTATVRWRRITR